MKSIAVILILVLSPVIASAQSDTYRYSITGTNAHLDTPNKIVTAFNLYFPFSHNGDYGLTLTTYPNHKQPLPGATFFLDITSQIAIKKGSSMNIVAAYPVSVYQLMDNLQWNRINGVTKINVNTYRVPVQYWGTFGIVRETDALYSARQVQPVVNYTSQISPLNKIMSPVSSFFKANSLLIVIVVLGLILYLAVPREQQEKNQPRFRHSLKEKL